MGVIQSPVCWLCQQPVSVAGPAIVWITSDLHLPIHSACWEQIPIEKRAEIAQRCYHHHHPGEQLAGLINTLRDAIEDGRGGLGNFYPSLN